MVKSQLLNRPEDVVLEAIDGLVATTDLVRLDGFPDIKVVLDPHHDRRNVAVVSGGGSGHEPAMVGYVGAGMLTAAVAGEVFASPSEDAVLAAIRAVTGPAGCLLIVMNYTGDRLNFGAAAERAKAEGLKVEMVVTSDDCALKGKRNVGRRGVAGTVLVHKVAGALAASGAPLAQVKAAAERAAAAVGTMGCSLTVCTLPGQPTSDRLAPGEMEMGLGIHGEPGAYKSKVKPVAGIVSELVAHIASEIDSYLPVALGERVALLVNNLGSSTPLEMSVAAKAAVHEVTHTLKARLERVYCGPFMTSLDMNGLSISLMRVDDATLALLDAPTAAPAWPKAHGTYNPHKQPLPVPAGPTDAAGAATSAGQAGSVGAKSELLQRMLAASCDAVLAAEAELNALDAQVGDGDCGTTLAKGAAAVKQRLADRSLPLSDPGATLIALGQAMGKAMGGSSGALYKIMLVAAGGALQQAQQAGSGGVQAAAAALAAGVTAVSKYGGAGKGDRTMLDALVPAVEVLQQQAERASPSAAAAASAEAALAGADATAGMDSAGAGRSSYVPQEALIVPDPGAVGVARWMSAVADVLKQQ